MYLKCTYEKNEKNVLKSKRHNEITNNSTVNSNAIRYHDLFSIYVAVEKKILVEGAD